MSPQPEPQVLFTGREVENAVSRLAAEISREYHDKNPLLLGILKGSFVFMADLIRRLDFPLEVVERHKGTGNIGRGLVTGFGLKKGALASSIAHDSHNIIAVGANDEDIFTAVKEIERRQGGLVVAAGGKVLASLGLPIAGLLSREPLETVAARLEELEKRAGELGATLPAPFAALSFLALPVIPELRLTDRGLVDVTGFRLIE